MLNVTASKDLVQRPPLASQYFEVGEHVQYWSETYHQWMQGVVQRVRDGGNIYDLDVKKGAHASKLRRCADKGLFDMVDRNHDGVISRREFEAALDSHVLDGSRTYRASQNSRLYCSSPSSGPKNSTSSAAFDRTGLREPIATPLTERGRLPAKLVVSASPPLSTRGASPASSARGLAVRGTSPSPALSTRGAATDVKPPSPVLSARGTAPDVKPLRGSSPTGCRNAYVGNDGASLARPGSPRPDRDSLGTGASSSVCPRSPRLDRDSLGMMSTLKESSSRPVATRCTPTPAESSTKGKMTAIPSTDWADIAGQDMVSRAGAATVRKMLEQEKQMLHALEGALIVRAGFIASCFHLWKCEATLGQHGRHYQADLAAHYDAWAAHLDQHKKSFEAELKAAAEHTMSRKEILKQQRTLLLDKWAHGDKIGTQRQSLIAWRNHVVKEKRLKRTAASTHTVILQWAEGKVKGLMRAGFLAWHHLAESEKQVRQREKEQEAIHGTYQQQLEELARQQEKLYQDNMAALEDRAKKGHRDIEMIIAKWKNGDRKGVLKMVLVVWHRDSHKSASSRRRASAVELQVRRWIEGDSKGTLHSCILQWKHLLAVRSLTDEHDEAVKQQVEHMQSMLTDAKNAHQSSLDHARSEEEKRKQKVHYAIEVAVSKWGAGESNGIKKEYFRVWSKFVAQVKQLGRKRQAVHDALLSSVEGDAKAAVHITFLNWKRLAVEVHQERSHREAQDQHDQQWRKFLQETQEQHDNQLQQHLDTLADLKAKARNTSDMLLKQWMGGDAKGLKSSVFSAWKRSKEIRAAHERNRNTVKGAVLRFAEGDMRACIQMAFMAWTNLAKSEAMHNLIHKTNDAKIAQLQKDIQGMEICHKEDRLIKYATMLGNSNGIVLEGMCFSGWKSESRGKKGEMEANLQREVQLKELERQHKMSEAMHKEEKARALAAMGCKDGRVVSMQAFSAWSYFLQKKNQAQAVSLNHNHVMGKYSSFLLDKQLKRNDVALQGWCFTEWHREANILMHQRHHDHAARTLDDTRAYLVQREHEIVDMQEQLRVYYQQIDQITETLQKELKTKEELASELRSAYEKLRKTSSIPISMALPTAHTVEVTRYPRNEGDQPLDHDKQPSIPIGNSKVGSSPSSAGAYRTTAYAKAVAEPLAMPKFSSTKGLDLLRCRKGPSSETSASHCDWDHVMAKMEEDGYVHLDGQPVK